MERGSTMELTRDVQMDLHRRMVRIRLFEESAGRLAEAARLLHRYLTRLRYPRGVPALGSDAEREPLIVGFASTCAGRPIHPGVNQRLVQRVVEQRAHEAATRFRLDAQTVSSLERVSVMLRVETQLSISLDSRDFERVVTVGDLLDTILAKLAAPQLRRVA